MKAYTIDLNKEALNLTESFLDEMKKKDNSVAKMAFMNAMNIVEVKNSFGKFWFMLTVVQLELIGLLVFIMLS